MTRRVATGPLAGRLKGNAMKPSLPLFAAALICLDLAPAASAAQASDEAKCSALATQQTGFDPARPPPPPATANPRVAGTGSRARGAAAGAVIGGVAGDAGAGAAAGAVAGGVTQRSRSRRAARSQNEAVAQQQQAGQAAYNQARANCLAARGK
jgi:hypothetical protein